MEPDVSPLLWLVTIGGLAVLLALDLLIVARRHQRVTIRAATGWIVCYVVLAFAFAGLLAVLFDGRAAGEFLAGYVTEYSLSADNLFVFMLIITRFAVPAAAVDRILYIGILVSLLLRGAFIAAGAAAVAAFNAVFYVFGAFLIYTAVQLVVANDDSSDGEGLTVRTLRRVLPTTKDYDGHRLIVTRDGRQLFTPVILVIAAIGVANVVFALDSIPAVFGLTTSAYIVLAANVFAMMGLRQLFFLISDLLRRIVYLGIGLAVVLGFIGLKLIVEALHGSHVDALGPVPLPTIGVGTSLAVIVGVLALTTLASVARSRWASPDSPS